MKASKMRPTKVYRPLGQTFVSRATAATYRIDGYGKAITCLLCNTTSHNIHDVNNRFCGRCHLWHDDPSFGRKQNE